MFNFLRRRGAAARGSGFDRAAGAIDRCVECLETRTLLSAAVDYGDFFWANGEKVSLLRVVDAVDTSTSNAGNDAAEQAGLYGPWGPTFDVDDNGAMLFEVAGANASVRLTDEVFARLVDVDPAAVFSTANGFSSYERVLGTTDQYVATVTGGVMASLTAANSLHGLAGIAFAHPNFLIEGLTATNDPLFASQWHLSNTGQAGGTVDADIDAPEAWATTLGSSEIVVAVLDVGFQLDHPDLAASFFRNTGEIAGNGIDDDGNGWIDDYLGLDVGVDNINTSQIEYDGDPSPANQYDNHGTAVAGAIAAQANNGIGGAGVAPGVRILPIKIGVSSSGGGFSTTVAALAAAVYYAAGRTADGTGTWEGADIANHSWSVSVPLTALTEAFDWAAANGRGGLGLANFVSTGNSGTSAISYPSSLASTIAIGATDNRGLRTSYSQYGTGIDFVAPGGGGPTGGWFWTTDRTGSDGYVQGDSVGITGTSFSAPTAAGIAALMLSVNPELTLSEIRMLLQDSASRDLVAGVTFDSSGWNSEYGYGWLNAASALAAVIAFGNTEDPGGGGGGDSGGGPGGSDPGDGSARFDDIIGRQDSTGLWWVAISNGERFQSQPWGAWSPSTNWIDFVSGDFNGDGRLDVAARDAGTGTLWVGLASDDGLITQNWGKWSTTVTLSEAFAGDFNGDGRTDLAVRVESAGDGRWYVAESTGNGFVTKVWGGWTTIKNWGQIQVGDFDGDGLTDLAGRIQNAGDGRWVVMRSTGTKFSGTFWGVWTTFVPWDIYTGDVNGDGRTDLITRTGNANDGRWFISISTGTGFQNGTWGHVAAHLALADAFVGDFTGDGLADVAVRLATDGQWMVIRSTGTAGVTENWGLWSTTSWANLVVGDFDGDGRADIAGRSTSTGLWQVARSTGTAFDSQFWGNWSGGNWTFAAAGNAG